MEVTKDNKNEITNGNVGDYGNLFTFKAGTHLINSTCNFSLGTSGNINFTYGLEKSVDGGVTYSPVGDSFAEFMTSQQMWGMQSTWLARVLLMPLQLTYLDGF
jgi:hypothetical protein